MWPNLQFPADLVTFTEEILSGKLHFLRSGKNLPNQHSLPSNEIRFLNVMCFCGQAKILITNLQLFFFSFFHLLS